MEIGVIVRKMIKRTLAALSFSLAPLAAQAGDPCPIAITVVDLGVPAWLDQEELLAAQGDVQIWLGVRSYQAAEGRAVAGREVDVIQRRLRCVGLGLEERLIREQFV